MYQHFESQIIRSFIRSKNSDFMFSLISILSLLGISLGVAVIFTVMFPLMFRVFFPVSFPVMFPVTFPVKFATKALADLSHNPLLLSPVKVTSPVNVPPARGIFVESVALSVPHSKVVGVLALALRT